MRIGDSGRHRLIHIVCPTWTLKSAPSRFVSLTSLGQLKLPHLAEWGLLIKSIAELERVTNIPANPINCFPISESIRSIGGCPSKIRVAYQGQMLGWFGGVLRSLRAWLWARRSGEQYVSYPLPLKTRGRKVGALDGLMPLFRSGRGFLKGSRWQGSTVTPSHFWISRKRHVSCTLTSAAP